MNVIAPYQPLKWQLPALRDKSNIMLLTGSAGGGKSRMAAEKIHAFCLKYDGATALVVRKAREFTKKSVVPMLQLAIGADPRVTYNKSDNMFSYQNGSVIYIGGMRDDMQREAVKSVGQEGGIDIVWMEEATAFVESDFNMLASRMRGTAASWRQIILTTNPGGPYHWINKRLIKGGEASAYVSRADDNPHNPTDYAEWLAALTGIEKLRLVDGLWVQAEGVVYDNFAPEQHVDESADYVSHHAVMWFVDDGYVYGNGPGSITYHPRVILFAQSDGRGGLTVFDEYYATGEVEEVSLANALAHDYAHPDLAYIDSSAAQLKARLWASNIQTMGATHRVSEGIKNLRRLFDGGQIHIHPRCANLVQELQSYQYDPNSTAAQGGERRPMKVDDHGPDALRYGAWHLRYET